MKEIMNVPNRVTIARVIMVPIFVVVMLYKQIPYADFIAGGIFIFACITDFFDGYIARKYNSITNFGKFMDPLADKLLVCSSLICFVAMDDCPMPVWIVIIIISREFIISGFRLVAAEKNIVIDASKWGKIKTTTQMIMSIVLIFDFRHPIFRWVEWILIYAALLFTIISLVDYIVKNKDVLGGKS